MREIKFRAWDDESRTMIYWALFDSDGTWTPQVVRKMLDEMPVMQYIGLKDKNGNRIYEGDICKTTDLRLYGEPEVFEIIWSEENFAFMGKGKDGALIKIHNTTNSKTSDLFERISNIYENPDLLK